MQEWNHICIWNLSCIKLSYLATKEMMKVGINVCFPIWYSCCIHYKTHINRVYLTKYILYLPIRLQKTVDTYRIFCEYETSFARGHDVSLDDIQRKATSSICMYSKEKNILFSFSRRISASSANGSCLIHLGSNQYISQGIGFTL